MKVGEDWRASAPVNHDNIGVCQAGDRVRPNGADVSAIMAQRCATAGAIACSDEWKN
jgi:hypothetical protein